MVSRGTRGFKGSDIRVSLDIIVFKRHEGFQGIFVFSMDIFGFKGYEGF